MSFKRINTGNKELDRVQGNVEAAFNGLPATPPAVVAKTSGPQYRCTGAEDFVFVNSNGGAVMIVLPAAPTKKLVVRVTSGTQPVSVMAPDGSQVNGAASATVSTSLQLVHDGTAWWSF